MLYRDRLGVLYVAARVQHDVPAALHQFYCGRRPMPKDDPVTMGLNLVYSWLHSHSIVPGGFEVTS